MTSSIVRPAEKRDASALAALEADCFGADAWSVAVLAEEIGRDDRVVLVAARDGSGREPEPVGYVDVGVVGDVADLHRIAVAPQDRRAGTASQLLAAGVAGARDRGAERMLLEVAEDNDPALGFYRRHGFAEISRRRGYYSGGRDALVWELIVS